MRMSRPIMHMNLFFVARLLHVLVCNTATRLHNVFNYGNASKNDSGF